MRIREDVIKSARKSHKIKTRIMLDLNISLPTVYRWLELNENNGNLTRLQVLLIFAQELGFTSKDTLEGVELSKLIQYEQSKLK